MALILYHASGAVCAGKARLVLAEKQLDYESRLLDLMRGEQLTPDYLRLNPEGVVPTLVHDGRVIVESTVIGEYLDEAFAALPLRPADAYGRARSQLWTRREDGIHSVVNTVTTIAVFRPDLLARSAAERRQRIEGLPDPARREKMAGLVEHGTGSPLVLEAMVRLARQLRAMQAALEQAPWLGGETFGLADAGLVSFFHRLELLQLAATWQEQYSKIETWLNCCKSRPSFSAAITGFLPEGAVEHYRNTGAVVAQDLMRLYSDALGLI